MGAQEIAAQLGGRLLGDDVVITRIAPLACAKRGDVAFVLWPKDIRRAKCTKASLLIMPITTAAEYANELSSSIIAVDDFIHVFNVLHQALAAHKIAPFFSIKPMIAPDAVIHQTAVIEPGAAIGSKTIIGAGVVIHRHVAIGENCIIKAHTVIGSDAFAPYGLDVAHNLPSLGSVVIEDGVNIGALCSIDRGLIGVTKIGHSSLIDNMVHLGHDAQLGCGVVIAAQSALAGFTVLQDNVTLGGQVGVVPHVTVHQGARINAKSLVHCDIDQYEIWSGNPSLPHMAYLRAYAYLKRMFKP